MQKKAVSVTNCSIKLQMYNGFARHCISPTAPAMPPYKAPVAVAPIAEVKVISTSVPSESDSAEPDVDGEVPDYPCGICHKEVEDNDEAILCESGCQTWFHRICSGLTQKAYYLLTAESQAEWVCDGCIRRKRVPFEMTKKT